MIDRYDVDENRIDVFEFGAYVLYKDHAAAISERDKLIDDILSSADKDEYHYERSEFMARVEAMRGEKG